MTKTVFDDVKGALEEAIASARGVTSDATLNGARKWYEIATRNLEESEAGVDEARARVEHLKRELAEAEKALDDANNDRR